MGVVEDRAGGSGELLLQVFSRHDAEECCDWVKETWQRNVDGPVSEIRQSRT
jgi:hypothetical protein